MDHLMRIAIGFLFSFSGLPQAHAQLPTYLIDVAAALHGERLSVGSPAVTDLYNDDSGNLSLHPTFAQEAILDFGDHQVRVYLIASRHDTAADLQFIEDQVRAFAIDSRKATLFIEQSDQLDADGHSLFGKLIAQLAPALLPAFERAESNPLSEINPHYLDSSPFANYDREWRGLGGRVLHMDLSLNFMPAALDFFAKQVGPAKAFEFFRLALDRASFTFNELQSLATYLYPDDFAASFVESQIDCCGTDRDWIAAFLENNQIRDLARERYMRSILISNANDGDVIITHPVHMKHLLGAEKRPQM